jgi:competence protein ComEA
MSLIELETGSPTGGPVSKKSVVGVEPGGGRSAAPAQPGGPFAQLRERYRQSVWAPVALKAAAILLFMLALAGVGAASILSGVQGVPVATGAPVVDDIGSAWLASQRRGSPAKTKPPGQAVRPSPASSASADSSDAGSPGHPRGITADGKVILNVASAEELTRLPGVGDKRARSIVKLRRRLKRFRRATDLLRVRGIGVRSLKRMLPHLVLDPPRQADAGARS